ncbi:hypothetical protein G6F65_022505 [Rhizopus arrhizus]|nr:hypothetical protein G6F65_022505 [Rhizopus arrhizus]
MPSALPTITVGMMARPSRPSVRFTALLVPTITAQNGTIKSARVGNAIVKPLPTQALKSGHSSVLAGADTANARYTAAIMPMVACQKNF